MNYTQPSLIHITFTSVFYSKIDSKADSFDYFLKQKSAGNLILEK